MAGIWIRSQDRTRLEYCDSVYIDQNMNSQEFYRGNTFCFRIDTDNITWSIMAHDAATLGVYSSKEKAMKVMDDIQEVIMGCKLFLNTGNSNCNKITYINNNDTKVFQMPEDEDVIIEEK